MKIVHVCQYFFPWLGYQEYYLAREQIALGHDVTVVTSNYRWPPQGNYALLADSNETVRMNPGRSVESGVPCVRLSVSWEPLGRPVLHGLQRALEQLRPNIVLAHGYLLPSTFTTAALQRRLGFQLIVDEHQLPSQSVPGKLHRILRRSTARVAKHWILPRASHIVAVALGTVEWLRIEYGVPEDRIRWIPLGVAADVFSPNEEQGHQLRNELGIEPRDFVVVYSGKVAPYKRVDVLIEAAGKLNDLQQSVTVVIVGKGDSAYLETLRRSAAQQRVRAIFHDGVPPARLAHFFNAADVCVWPADCTISHLEAAACRKPIIVPDDPGIRDRIDAGNGIAVAVGDADDMTCALAKLRSDPELRRTMGIRSLELVRKRYTWQTVARAFDSLS